ncbi:hypothetical protein M758_1G249400 [Ceratodon purpureus]|uniref:pectinesterase n=1 Tax=Ceratodon purpureus TaxID=3225 RepID=A0A8T0JBQ4_CERPU|nr:hypothetical protein KC19_1G255700 [Ceratodon purpureus]KAG0631386.1 hypothetical protein M758_1G249400 [Ceratodon purpureus]
MAESVLFVLISRYITLVALVLTLSNALDQCHGQWWFAAMEATPPSSSTSVDSSTASPPSPGSSTSVQATPPSSLTSGLTDYSSTATPPASSGFTTGSAATPPTSTDSSWAATPPASSTGSAWTATPPSSTDSAWAATPPASSTGSAWTASPPPSTYSSWTATPPSPGSYSTATEAPPPSDNIPAAPATSPASTSNLQTPPAVSTSSSSVATTTSSTVNSTTLIVGSFPFGPETIYTSVQDAIDAVPEDNTDLYTIEILSGTYLEKVSIPSTKPFITLQGAGRDTTIITYNDTANSTGSTIKSSTFFVAADNFTARNLTFKNSAPYAEPGDVGAQAVALRITGDMASFYGCGFVSSQDTICDEAGRHYFRDCYIEGNIDIIWGNGQSLYEYCQIESTARNVSKSGCITAQGRAAEDESTGFTFVGGSITGSGSNLLGRAYGLYSRVFFIDTYMEDIISPEGWSDWPTTASNSTSRRLLEESTTRHEYYGEYGNTGPGANLTGRVSWMISLTEAEAANFSSIAFIDGSSWLTSET